MVIKEFLPNPVGSDQEGEYIKIFNDSPAAVLLNGWSLKDASGKTFKLIGSLDSQKELVLPYSQTKIALNNNGEQIFLYNSSGKLIDQLSYTGQASEGQIIVKGQKPITNNQKLVDSNFNSPVIDYQFPIHKVIFLDFLIAAILAGLGLYLILQIEKKLGAKIW
ncbi:MAG: lamin tail domain-containing protein [bacterium]|nr:lamin tail domain-containing protein [bacterium]